MTHNSSPSVLTSSITVSADTTTNGATEKPLEKITANTESTEKTTSTTEATEKIITTTGDTSRTVATTRSLKKTIPITMATTQTTTTNETTEEKTTATPEATETIVETTLAAGIATSGATLTPARTTTPATHFPNVVIHVHETHANVSNNTGATRLPTMPSEFLSFYIAVFWVPTAVLGLVMVIACIRTIWRLHVHVRRSKETISSYEGVTVAYDKLNEPENIYLELNRMSTTAPFSNDGEGNQYYSTVASIREHAKLRSENRALTDPALSRKGIISDGQPQRESEAHSYLFLIS